MPQIPHMEMHEELEDRRSGLPHWLLETPYWAISAVVHLMVLLAIGTIVLIQYEEEEVIPPLSTISLAQEPEPYEKEPTVHPSPTHLDEITPDLRLIVPTVPEVVVEEPEGDPDEHSDRDISVDVSLAMGLDGGQVSRAGREGLGRELPYANPGGGADAVLKALWWLVRHQNPDGSWSSADFTVACKDAEHPCANLKSKYGDGRGFEGYDVGVTGLAMLAYLGFGHTDQHGKIRAFRLAMKKAKAWMLKQQSFSDDPALDGIYGSRDQDEWIYNHAIATMAMAELLVLSRDQFSKLPRSVDAATRYCLRSRNEGYGWKYQYGSGKNDTSVTGWMVLALKTSKVCSEARLIRVPRDRYRSAFDGAIAWFDRSTSTMSGVTGYMSPGDAGSQLQGIHPEPYPYSKDLSCMTAVSTLCRLFAGQKRTVPAIKQGAEVLMKELPVWREQKGKRRSKVNLYYWYYASYAMYQYGGTRWNKWNTAMLDALVHTQRVGGDEDGSWDPIGEWGAAGGRVYATALGAMTLEVYYRYRRLSGT